MRSIVLSPSQRRVPAFVAVVVSVLVAGIIALALRKPIEVLAALIAAVVAIVVVRYPIPTLGALLFVAPFHNAIFAALQVRVGPMGALGYWKDAIVVALFARALAGRVFEDRRFPTGNAGDSLLLFAVLAYLAAAILSPPRASVYPALGRYVEGPLLLLAIRFLRPSRRELWFLAAAVVAAATVIGAAAVIEWVGPRADFHRWYGASPTADGLPFRVGDSGYRSGSFIYDPLVLGFYLGGTTPFAVALAVIRTRWRFAALTAAAACGGGLIASLTRSGLIGGGIAILVVLALTVRNPGIRFSLIGLMVVVSGSITLYYVSGGNETLVRSDSNTLHRQRLERSADLVFARPLGYGLGTTDRYRFREGTQNDPGQLGATESTYLARALEGGVQGLLLYLLTLFITGMRLRSARLRSLRTDDRTGFALAAGGIGSLLAVSLSGLFLGVHELPVEYVLWIPAGIALAWASRRQGAAPPTASTGSPA